MPNNNRIWFKGNPWSEGHPLKAFAWMAEIRDGVVWFFLHLKSADYDAERKIADDGKDSTSDWESPIVWNNYHSCTISSTEWHDGGFPVCPVEKYSAGFLDGFEAVVDPLPIDSDADLEELAFHTYLLGHDSVAGHRIKFTRCGTSDRFDIHWEGKIALVYAGDDEYRYDFIAKLFNVPWPAPSHPQ